jgi:acyl-coenzyme A thioesterase 13
MAPPSKQNSSSPRETPEAYKVDESLSMKERMDTVLESFRNNPACQGKWETQIMQNTTCVAASARQGTVVYEIDIQDSFCTLQGHLHGGAASTILDQLTSFVLHMYAKPGFMENGAVTRTLTVTCLRPVVAGTKLRVEAELASIGRTMGNVKGLLKTMDGKTCFACTHDKVILPSHSKL